MNEEQREEILALEAILGNAVDFDESSRSGSIEIAPALEREIRILLRGSDIGGAAAATAIDALVKEATVGHLPGLTVRFTFPDGYPASDPPTVDQIESDWLSESQVAALKVRLDAAWEESRKDVVVYQWHQVYRIMHCPSEYFFLTYYFIRF